MGFVVKPYSSARIAVTFTPPGEESTSTIHATWRLCPWDEYTETRKRMRDGEFSDEQLIERDLKDLEDIKDEKGHPMPFSLELARELMQYIFFRRAMVDSWFAAQEGASEYRQKNS